MFKVEVLKKPLELVNTATKYSTCTYVTLCVLTVKGHEFNPLYADPLPFPSENVQLNYRGLTPSL